MSGDALQLRCWEGYERAEFLAAFTQASGVQVSARTLIADGESAIAIARGDDLPDVLNINNAWVRDYLEPRGAIATLDQDLADAMRAAGQRAGDPALVDRLRHWCFSRQGECIGVAQRYGAFNLVVNTRTISRASAEQQGFALADDAALKKRYGILLFDDFNLFHLCIAAGHNPFASLSVAALSDVETTAQRWLRNCAVVTDSHLQLNQMMLDGAIDFYISGGVYTASPLRRDGHLHIRGITPLNGPIEGSGAIAFCEINCVLQRAGAQRQGQDFLRYLLSRNVCRQIAMTPNTCNPLLQMQDPAVLSLFDRQQLDVIQWDGLDEEIARCADYQLMPNRSEVLQIWHRCLLNSPKM